MPLDIDIEAAIAEEDMTVLGIAMEDCQRVLRHSPRGLTTECPLEAAKRMGRIAEAIETIQAKIQARYESGEWKRMELPDPPAPKPEPPKDTTYQVFEELPPFQRRRKRSDPEGRWLTLADECQLWVAAAHLKEPRVVFAVRREMQRPYMEKKMVVDHCWLDGRAEDETGRDGFSRPRSRCCSSCWSCRQRPTYFSRNRGRR